MSRFKPSPALVLRAGCLGAISALLVSASAASAMTVGPNCTLPDAVAAVDANDSSTACGAVVSGATTPISVPAGTYTLTAGELTVDGGANLAIVGADPAHPSSTVIDANHASRVLEVLSGGQAALSAVEITGGRTADGIGLVSGSVVPVGDGGGILNAGSLSLDHVLVSGNATGNGGRGVDGDGPDGARTYGRSGGSGGLGGGIASNGPMTMTASVVTANHAGAGGDGGNGSNGGSSYAKGADGGVGGPSGAGGGIYLGYSSATITTSTISQNTTGVAGNGGNGGTGSSGTAQRAQGDGGYGGDAGNNGRQLTRAAYNVVDAFYGGGGGIASVGTLTMTDSTISDNITGAGGRGGGAGISGPSTGGQYYGNQSGGVGGGGGAGGGMLSAGRNSSASLTNVTISANHAGAGGHGGNHAQSGGAGGGNGGYGGDGAGLWATGYNGNGIVALDHVTIAGNVLGAGGAADGTAANQGADGIGGGIRTSGRYSGSASGYGVSVKNSIVAGNGVPNCSHYYTTYYDNDVHDAGNDLTYQVVAAGSPTDTSCLFTNADPMLGPLQDNGGPTFTMLPGGGSAAIDAGTCDVPDDQRGYARPSSGCDIGAVEAGATAPGGGGTSATATSLSSSANPSTAGDHVSLTATISPAPDGGSVRFTDGGTTIPGCDAVPLAGADHASCAVQYGASGSRTIVAEYLGDASYGASTSSPLTQVVKPASSGGPAAPQPQPQPQPQPSASFAASASFAGSPTSVRVSKTGRLTYRFAATPTAGGKITFTSTKRVKIGSTKRKLTLTKAFTAPSSAKVTVKLKLSRNQLKALKHAKRLRFKVTVTLAAKTFTTKLTVKAPKKS